VILRGKLNGAKLDTEAMGCAWKRASVGERSVRGEGIPEGVLERTEVRMQA
jgi:hypothetical protein